MKSGWMKKFIKKDENEEENFKIEQNINEDQNSANLKNEIMGNNQNKPNFSSERPSVIPNTQASQTQTVAPTAHIPTIVPKKKEPEAETTPVSVIKPISNISGEESEDSAQVHNPTPVKIEESTPIEPGSSVKEPPKLTAKSGEVDDVQELMDKMKVFDSGTASEAELAKIKRRVRRREKKKVIQFKLFNRLATVLIIFGATVLLITIIYIIYINMPTRSGSTIQMGKVVQVKNSLNKYSLVVTEAETNVSIARASTRGSSSYSYGAKQFTRVKIQIKNNKGTATPIRGINDFYLVDASHKVLATCLTQDDLKDYNAVDALPSSLPAKGIIEGYVYCETNLNYLPYLEVVSAEGISSSSSPTDNTKRTGEDYYYINLGKNRTIK